MKLDLSNLHGDTVATIDPTATSIGSYHETTEYGLPRDPATAADDYGWLGGKKRSSDDLGGLTLMGVRLYNPATGRFLSVDPIPGGNANAYTYPPDPINGYDLTGMQYMADGFCPTSSCGKKPNKAKSSPKKEKSKSCGLGCHLASAGAHATAKVTGGVLTTVHAVKHAPKLVKSVIKVNNGSDLGEELGEWKTEISRTLGNAKKSPGYPNFSGMSSALGVSSWGMATRAIGRIGKPCRTFLGQWLLSVPSSGSAIAVLPTSSWQVNMLMRMG